MLCENCDNLPPEGSQRKTCSNCHRTVCVMCWGDMDGDLCGKCEHAEQEAAPEGYNP
jgi:hypothetical protein